MMSATAAVALEGAFHVLAEPHFPRPLAKRASSRQRGVVGAAAEVLSIFLAIRDDAATTAHRYGAATEPARRLLAAACRSQDAGQGTLCPGLSKSAVRQRSDRYTGSVDH